MNTETVARVVAALQQHGGHLTVATATNAGIDRVTLKRAADAGIIRRLGRGNYAANDASVRELAFKGAHLGREAVLSHRGAAFFWGLDGVEQSILEWSIPHSAARTSSKLIHRRRRFEDLVIVEKNGFAVTSVAQTLGDLGAYCDADIVERANESALRKDLADETDLRAFARDGTVSRHGGPTMRAVLDRRPHGARPTGSDVETICMQVYRRGGVPTPQRQWPVYADDGRVVGYADFGFPPKAFLVEIDGLESHGTEAGTQYDHNRQNRIEDLGYRFRRFTAKDVLYRPKYVCDATMRGLALAPQL